MEWELGIDRGRGIVPGVVSACVVPGTCVIICGSGCECE